MWIVSDRFSQMGRIESLATPLVPVWHLKCALSFRPRINQWSISFYLMDHTPLWQRTHRLDKRANTHTHTLGCYVKLTQVNKYLVSRPTGPSWPQAKSLRLKLKPCVPSSSSLLASSTTRYNNPLTHGHTHRTKKILPSVEALKGVSRCLSNRQYVEHSIKSLCF